MIWKNGWIAWNRRSTHWQKNSVPIFIQKSDKTQTVVLVLQTETYCEIYIKCILYCGCKWKWRVIVAVNFQFKQLEGRSLKKYQGFNGIRTRDLRETGAIVDQLSFKATQFISSLEVKLCEIYMKCMLYCGCRWQWRVITAQLVEHRTGTAEVTGLNPVEALIFFRLLLSSYLNWKIYCDDRSSLLSTTAVQHEFRIVPILVDKPGDLVTSWGGLGTKILMPYPTNARGRREFKTWQSQWRISSVLLELLLSAFGNRKCGKHGEWSVTFWHWNTAGVKELDAFGLWCWKSQLIGHAVEL